MVPLRDENPIKITPYVTYVLIALNILVFVYELTLIPPQLDGFFHLFAVVPRELTANFNGISVHQPVPEALTLVTSQFLHAGFTHVGFNMLFLWIFGNNIEEELGSFKFLIFLSSLWYSSSTYSMVFLCQLWHPFTRGKWRNSRCDGCIYSQIPSSQNCYFNSSGLLLYNSQNTSNIFLGILVFTASF